MNPIKIVNAIGERRRQRRILEARLKTVSNYSKNANPNGHAIATSSR